MKKLISFGLGALSLLGLAGCGATLQLKDTRLADAEAGRTFLLVNAAIQAGERAPAPPKGSCELRTRNRDDGKTYAFPVKAKEASVLVEVVPGRYVWDSFHCPAGSLGSTSQSWTIGDRLVLAALVQPGKVNYAGRIRLTVGPKEDQIAVRYGSRGEDAAALTSALKALPASVRAQAVTAYSGKPVSLEAIASKTSYQRSLAITKKGQDKLKTDELNAALDTCDRDEQESNPVRLGSLAYDLEFENDTLKKLDRVTDRHTMSDQYVSCVEGAFRAFKPGSGAAIVYRIQL